MAINVIYLKIFQIYYNTWNMAGPRHIPMDMIRRGFSEPAVLASPETRASNVISEAEAAQASIDARKVEILEKIHELNTLLNAHVEAARILGIPWTAIGQAAGLSEMGATHRWVKEGTNALARDRKKPSADQ